MYDYSGYYPIATIIFGIKYIGNVVEKIYLTHAKAVNFGENKKYIFSTGNANSSDTLFLPRQQSVCVQNKHSTQTN